MVVFFEEKAVDKEAPGAALLLFVVGAAVELEEEVKSRRWRTQGLLVMSDVRLAKLESMASMGTTPPLPPGAGVEGSASGSSTKVLTIQAE